MNGGFFNRIARLRATGIAAGTLDETFTLGAANEISRATNGANGAVNVIAVQLDGKILIGGDFNQFSGRTRNGLTRLNSDGSLDPTINFGTTIVRPSDVRLTGAACRFAAFTWVGWAGRQLAPAALENVADMTHIGEGRPRPFRPFGLDVGLHHAPLRSTGPCPRLAHDARLRTVQIL